ncbi:MAG: hypothetical protein HY242_05530 [Afipia sp.]|nr:hypothetical protein [Afipia sp.]
MMTATTCIRVFVIGCAMLVSGCSISFDRSEPISKPVVDPAQQKNIDLQVLKIVETMKGSTAVSLSDIGPNQAQSGPALLAQCARVTFPSRTLYYTFFVRDEKVSDWRPAVLNDDCETRIYLPRKLGSSSSIY